MKSRILLSRISSSTLSLRVGSVTATHYTHPLAGHRRLDGKSVDRTVVETRLHRLLDQLVLLDPREALELRRGDGRAQVIVRARLVDDLDLRSRQGGLDHQTHLVGRNRHRSGGRLGGPGSFHKLAAAAELDARAAMRFAGLDLGGVDRLPPLEGDVFGLALGEQALDRAAVDRQLRIRELLRLQVLEEAIDRLLSVLLVGADHAGGAPLDPADRVKPGHDLARAVVDPATLIVDQSAAFVERHPVDRHARVADRAQHHAALDRLALAGVDGADAPGVVALELVAGHHDPLHLATPLDLDRGAEEAHHDLLVLALRLAL